MTDTPDTAKVNSSIRVDNSNAPDTETLDVETRKAAALRTYQDALDQIIREHGGAAAFNTAQMLAARGLVRILAAVSAGDVRQASSIEALERLLPPRAAGGGQIDLSKLDDAELDALEAMVAKAGTVAPPEPGSERAQINELLAMNETLQGIIAAREREADAARQGEETWRRLAENAGAACDDMRKRLEAAEAAAWRAAHPEPQQAAPGQPEAKPSNVVPLAR